MTYHFLMVSYHFLPIRQVYILQQATPRYVKGIQHPTISPYETFKASDEYINIAVGNDKFWHIFCDLIGLEENDPKFAANPDRVKNRDELFSIIQHIISQKTAEEWLLLFQDHGIPAGPVLTLDKVLTHPQILARNMVVEC